MALQIIDADQPLKVENIIITLYGAPDAGKTTLAQTSEKPFLEDYDEGIQRCAKRNGKTAAIKDWSEAVEFHQSGQLKTLGIETLIIDTAGTMLDNFVARHIMEEDPKMKMANGTLHLRGYGAMKSIFNQFRYDVKAMGVDVIFIAHDTDKEERGETKKSPKVTGGSYDILKAATDLMGYMHFKNGKRFIGFNTTDDYDGKNCAELPIIEIPHYEHPDFEGFMARLIQKTKDKMNAMSEEMAQAQQKVNDYKEYINNSNNFDELGMIWDDINDGLSQTYKVQVLKVYEDKFLKLFEDMTKKVEKTEEIDEVVLFAADQPKQFAAGMRKYINEKMKDMGFMYDKEAKKTIVDPNAKKETDNKKEIPPADAKKKTTTTRKKTISTKSEEEAQEQSLNL